MAIPKDIAEVSVDFPFMVKAFFNLIDNAIKYSPNDSLIEISAYKNQDKIEIKVKDQGCGIPREDLKRIFEKFYRVERSQRASGTGLGLCISKGIVEAHAGQIGVESELGKGTIFTVMLPLV
jgi:two-component system sensor histidine kinase VicK